MAKRTWTGAAGDGDPGNEDNYLEASVPVTGDDLYFEHNAKSVSANLGALAAVRLGSLQIAQTYTGQIGTPAAYLQIGAALVSVGAHHGAGSPAGSSRLKLDLKHFDAEDGPIVEVLRTALQSADAFRPPVRLLLADSDALLYVRKGLVGLAVEYPSETSILNELHMSFEDSVDSDAQVVLGPGVAWTEINKVGGRLVVQSAGTTLRNAGGRTEVLGTGALGTLRVEGGTVYPESSGTIALLECRGGVTDFLRSRRARTVTQTALWRGASLRYDPAIVTMTAEPALQEAASLEVREG